MKKRKWFFYIAILIVLMIFSGCSKREINRQIAESLGTLGQYENDEPVESPKMKAEKEMKESKERIELEVSTRLANAEKLATQFDYQGALDELALINKDYQDYKEVVDSRIHYTKLRDAMQYHAGTIAHFSVGNLAVDRDKAYKDPEMGQELNDWTLTTEEFKKILQQLYDNGYVLTNVADLVSESVNEKGETILVWEGVLVPEGKKPIVLSFTGAGYEKSYYNLGFSNRMVLTTDGEVKNEYTDASGKTKTGDYDMVPILETFIKQHPDFSLRGAKGILAITGYRGAYGYDPGTDGEMIRKITEKLKNDGWIVACQGYRGMSMESELDADGFVEDMENWSRYIGKYVGDTSLLIYPNGNEIPLYAFKHLWALEHGYHLFFNQWATTDTLTLYEDCLIQSRRKLDGYDLHNYGKDMERYFDYKKILDKERPSFE